MIKSHDSIILIAEYNGNPVGCGAGEIMHQHANWCIYKYKGNIGLMFVKKGHRKKGIGKLILNSLMEWFSKKNIKDIRLQVYQNNKNAIKLYKKEGFKDYIMELIYNQN